MVLKLEYLGNKRGFIVIKILKGSCFRVWILREWFMKYKWVIKCLVDSFFSKE